MRTGTLVEALAAGDGVNSNDKAVRRAFPYLALPHSGTVGLASRTGGVNGSAGASGSGSSGGSASSPSGGVAAGAGGTAGAPLTLLATGVAGLGLLLGAAGVVAVRRARVQA